MNFIDILKNYRRELHQYQWHHPAYTINEACLEIGARYLASLAQEYLNKKSCLTYIPTSARIIPYK